ncbi:DUF262 domain-containing protein [Sphaerisporangium album]|uniref:DUF262 domain-containing protein n=1 Tax=Sphaerisporangium album TaxID=509200 RepID=A0A367FM88_9ACTN|nr:DUF262 domain-containing protein [Sphaerisporangium album]RCG31381.1 DUF262 domain-containing protein [Sphaerisporangium album]
MTAEDYDIDVKPEIMLMEQVLAPLADGELRIPKFQRPFVWRPEQILDLFDSIERGYPIGSLLFWETSEPLASLDRIGDLPVPPPREGRSVAYVLDGHQRLSALFATLRRPADARRSTAQSDWMWWPYRILGEAGDGVNRYRHWKRPEAPPANYLPLRSVLRTIDFLAYARELAKRAGDDMDVDQLTGEAELVAQRIKSYKLAVVRLVGGSLEDAVEVFSRVNSTGQPMRPAQMVSALTYHTSGQQSLADRLDEMIELIADTGFGEVSPDAVFRSVLAVSGEENVQEARWDVLARRVKDNVQKAVDATEEALTRAVNFLRDVVGVPLARLIPYDAQLMLLTTFFHDRPKPTPQQIQVLIRWFWVTSWSGHFAGANTTQIRQSLAEMRAFARGHGELSISDERPRPFPNRFDLRSARVRAFIIWELQELPERLSPHGEGISPADLLARGATSAYRHVITRPGVAAASSPANRLIMPTAPRVSVKNALLNLPEDVRSDVLESHAIPARAMGLLAAGDDEGFIEARRTELAERERDFMASFGLSSDASLVGEADIDTG